MSGLEIKKKVRAVSRGSFTKYANELEAILSLRKSDLQTLQVCHDIVNDKFNELKTISTEYFNLLIENDASEIDLAADMDSCDAYERRFKELMIKSAPVLSPPVDLEEARGSVVSEHDSDTRYMGKRKFKLPMIQFKQFNGNVRDWLSFWSQFQKVDEDPDIDAADKVEYLVQATAPGSRARNLVNSFPATADNYEKIVDSLKSRFGREDIQIEVYVRELLKLVLNNAVSKAKPEVSTLYDSIETQLRALETLGITSDKYSSILFPLIESCLPEELLRVWQRTAGTLCVEVSGEHESEEDGAGSVAGAASSGINTLENRLKALLKFLRNEVENEQRILMASEGFGLQKSRGATSSDGGGKSKGFDLPNVVPTAADLVNHEQNFESRQGNTKCVFCEKSHHDSQSCFKAQSFTLEKRKEILSAKRACFRCLKVGHQSRKCRARLKCVICSRNHAVLMCPESTSTRSPKDKENNPSRGNDTSGTQLSCTNASTNYVFLQTLKVKIMGENGLKEVRALIDTGSQRSYILKSTAQALQLVTKSTERIMHCLFGGVLSEQSHGLYEVHLLQNNGNTCRFDVLDQPKICCEVPSIFPGSWLHELMDLNIEINDVGLSDTVELLIGSDIAGNLYTGRRQVLSSGLVAMETLLGWVLMGKVPMEPNRGNISTTILSCFVMDCSISNLWELDVLGITEPVADKTKHELEKAALEFFDETVQVNEEGRYEVRLPWLEGHPPLATNYFLAKKRLQTTLKRLESQDLYESYDAVFKEWLHEGIIEVVSDSDNDIGHYLPHRPVVKTSCNTTTKIRPVFDASAKIKGKVSLNQCLEKGPNLIELIPEILIRFRKNRIGVTSDIRKAFLQISVHPTDRDFLRFIWRDSEGREEIYRHRRVVFGVTSSPFLLAATINHHLQLEVEKHNEGTSEFDHSLLSILAKSFYVDNCVTSVPDLPTLKAFVRQSSLILAQAQFDLRGWEFSCPAQITSENSDNKPIPLLGLVWNTRNDTLGISKECVGDLEALMTEPVTKRIMLSLAQRVFDPIGFACPTTLIPKLLLQQTWKDKLAWDAEVGEDIKKSFRDWMKALPILIDMQVPRWIGAFGEGARMSLHTFCDASKGAYGTAVFLRCAYQGEVHVTLLAAKSRVAPIKIVTIPRMELLAAVIGTRLCNTVKKALELESLQCFFWTDSTTVLSWIKRNEVWCNFVCNRVTEIRKTTTMDSWCHVPGAQNPADLPSRGCSPQQLYESKWWEGPNWLYENPNLWPHETVTYNEPEIFAEKKKGVVTLSNSGVPTGTVEWHLTQFTSFIRTTRMIGRVLRFKHNIRHRDDKRVGELSAEEMNQAEIFILLNVQNEVQKDSFSKDDPRLKTLQVFLDDSVVLRLKSRIANREDNELFRMPIVLPSHNAVIEGLVWDTHRKSCHVGVQGLLSLLREKYWILGGRRYLKSVISKCAVCRRHASKSFQVQSPPLPADRVKDASAFEITGVDFAGPLHLKTGEKVWICIFTCAVYRAVHLELATSLSTECFVKTLRRFVARRGRPKIVYSDNGTNFVGTNNLFKKLQWSEIEKFAAVERITWRFNPPTAAWWGGFWERLVGILKRLLRKVLGRAALTYEDLLTVICDCEQIINSRPLTYISEDASELVPLTPVMFTRDLSEGTLPECEVVDRSSLCRKIRRIQKIRDDLRLRFRNEYLGQLQNTTVVKASRPVKVGEVVLVGHDNSKRIDWPLGRITEVLPGKDGAVRLVRVSTANGMLLRPVQRVYPLEESGIPVEMPEMENESTEAEVETTSTEVTSKKPEIAIGSEKSRASVSEVSESPFAENGSDQSRVPAVKTTRVGRVTKLPARYMD